MTEYDKLKAEYDAVVARVGEAFIRPPSETDTVTAETGDQLVDRLHGIYTIPVNDGAGLLDGKNTFTRRFPPLPINLEAADEIVRLRQQCDRLLTGGLRLTRILDDELDYRPGDEAGGEYAEACAPFHEHLRGRRL